MKIVHIISGELTGGAARGAYNLHQALLSKGIDSYIINNGKLVNDDKVVNVSNNYQKIKKIILKIIFSLPLKFYRKRKNRAFNTGFGGIDFINCYEYRSADLVHLHWINGLVSFSTLKKIKKPLVWTMRDMWPFTGGCHYSMDCNNYISGCGKCKQLNSQSKFDYSRFILHKKKKVLPNNIKMIGISEWLSACARNSRLLTNVSIKTIHNCVDVKKFVAIKKEYAREILDLPNDKKIVLVGAQKISDFYKGFDLLVNALNDLSYENIHVLMFGKISSEDKSQFNFDYTHLGFLSDIYSLRLAYSASDVFVAPSRMEAFGKTIIESMACETPVVAFSSTGPADIVLHKVTGYLATPYDSQDLTKGILWVISDMQRHKSLCKKSRQRVEQQFSNDVIAEQYIRVYNSAIEDYRDVL